MAKKDFERKPSRIATSFRNSDSREFYSHATPFVQRTRLFLLSDQQNEAQYSVKAAAEPPEEDIFVEKSIDDLDSPDSALDSRPTSTEENKLFQHTRPNRGSLKKKFFPITTNRTILNFLKNNETSSEGDPTSPKKYTTHSLNRRLSEAGNSESTSSLRRKRYSSPSKTIKKTQELECPVTEDQTFVPGISYAPGWSLKGEHLAKWQENGKTTIQVSPARCRFHSKRTRPSFDTFRTRTIALIIQVGPPSFCAKASYTLWLLVSFTVATRP